MEPTYLQVAIEAVKAAEEIILSYYQTNLTISTKEDHTPVTIADKLAEDVIRKTIHAAFPGHTFHGEEGSKVDLHDHTGYTWIIDPIDGTKSFIRGIPTFGTLLALLHDGILIVGVSNSPVFGELMYATKGGGAFLNDTRLTVSDVTSLKDAYITNSGLKYYDDIAKMPQLLNITRQVAWARGMGDFSTYHLLATGKIDIAMEAKVKFWDIAPATLIVQEAGGTVTQLDGKPITPESTTILATNGHLHNEVLSIMQSA
jgi:histidinol-phosphatase